MDWSREKKTNSSFLAVYVKPELQQENVFVINNDVPFTINEECDPEVMEFTEEKPVLDDIGQIVQEKNKNAEGILPAPVQDFVFVTCADAVAFNEGQLEQQNANKTNSDTSRENINVNREKSREGFNELPKSPLNSFNNIETTLNNAEIVPNQKILNVAQSIGGVEREKHRKEINEQLIDKAQRENNNPRLSSGEAAALNKEVLSNQVVKAKKISNSERCRRYRERKREKIITVQVPNGQFDSSTERIQKYRDRQKEKINRSTNEMNQLQIHHVVTLSNLETGSNEEVSSNQVVKSNQCQVAIAQSGERLDYFENNSTQEWETAKVECPHCGKHFQQLDAHKIKCDSRFIYLCTLCSLALMDSNTIKRHLITKHSNELKSAISIDKIAREIIAKRKELNVTSAAERSLAILELMRIDRIQSMQAPLKDRIEAQQQSTAPVDAETPRSDNAIVDEEIDLPVVDKLQNQSITQKKDVTNQRLEYFSCNECFYKTPIKVALARHIIRCHAEQLNLRNFTCNKCEKTFQAQYLLSVHKASCNVKMYYYCPFCPKSMMYPHMSKHVLTRHSKEIENKNSDEIKDLIMAKKKAFECSANVKPTVKNTERQYIFCDHCNYKTLIKDYLAWHIKRNHSEELNLKYQRVTCPKCYKRMLELDLESHSSNCGATFQYACIFCPMVNHNLRLITKHVLFQHSAELINKTIEQIKQEVISNRTKVKAKIPICKQPIIDPYKIDGSSLEYLPAYCYKCKKLKTSFGKARMRMNNCDDCNTQMIYLCPKCKEVHSIRILSLTSHWKQCTNYYEISQDLLDKLVLYTCSECSYASTHKHKFNSHISRTKHKAAEITNVEENKNNQTEDLVLYDEAKFAIQRCVTDFATMCRRYCPKCDKVVTEDMQKFKYATNESCQACGTRFLPQCVKCNANCKSYLLMRYHLNNKCFPGEYKCIKCEVKRPCWQLMQKHYVVHHSSRDLRTYLCEFCSFKSTHRINFYMHMKKIHPDKAAQVVPADFEFKKRDIDYACDKCSFTSKRKASLKGHLEKVHGPKKHKCKFCEFRTKYEVSFKRHMAARHRNCY